MFMESTTSENKYDGLLKHGLRYGAIYGIFSVLLTVLIYVIDFSLLAEWKLIIVFLAMAIAFVIYAGINYRTEVGGFIPYGKAFLHGLVVLGVSGLISSLFNGILFQFIDPDMTKSLVSVTLEKTEEMMRGFGMPEDKMEEALTKAEQDTIKRFTLLGSMTGYLWSWIFYLILSSITSAFVKRKPPETF
jgi:hypothetical protein